MKTELTAQDLIDGVTFHAVISYFTPDPDVGYHGEYEVENVQIPLKGLLIRWQALEDAEVFDDCETAREIEEAIADLLDDLPVHLQGTGVEAVTRFRYVKATSLGIMVEPDLDLSDSDFTFEEPEFIELDGRIYRC